MAKPNNDYNLKQNELNSKNNNNLGITSFCNFRKKGFTLIEIMAIIILLSVISIIIYPVINNTISKSEDDLYDQQIEELVRLSNAWVAGNAIDLVPKEGFTYDLTFEELATQGYIVEKDIINPKTGEVFPGCMKVTYNSVDSNYNVSYDEACEAETGDVTPIINLVVDEGVINSAGYAVRDFNVKVLGSNIASYKYCTGTRECEPIVSVNGNSGNIAITNEGITYVCVIGKKGSKTTKKLCKSYKLDKSDFVMGELVIDGTLGENGWYTSDVKLSVRDVEGVTSKLNINSITENTKGTEVILTSTSKSGKTGTKKYTVKVDKTAPVAGTLNVIGTKGGNGWFLSDVVFIVNDGSDNLSGHASTTSTHTSITSNTTGTEVIVTTKDKAGNTSTRSYVIKVNKSIPAAGELVIDGTLGDNGWYTSDVNLSVKDEVGVTSTLNINKINYDTAGTEIIMTSINNLTGASKTTKYTIKVDKTKPIVGELVISGVKGDNDWYKGDVRFSVKDGSDSMSGHSKTTSSITSITKDTKGTKVVVTTKDKAGNTNTKEYIVKMDKTAPVAGTLTISGTKGSGDWYLSDVTFKVNDGSDATSGHAKTTSTHTSVSGNTSGTVVTVTTTDKAGNTATRKYTIKINKDAPTAGKLVVDGTLGENGWYVSDVKLSVQDVTGVTSKLNITEITSDTAGTEVTMTSKNNTTGAVNVTKHTIKVDKTKPTVGELVISGTKGNNGWYKSNVTFSVKNGSDALSGHSSTASSISSITTNTKGTNVVVTTKDKAGNSATKTYTIKVDKTKPTITAKGTSFEIEKGTNKNSSTYFNTPKFGISGGSMNCSPATTGSLSSGTHTLTCTATGGNGNQAKATVSLVVKAMYADGSGANIPELYKNMVPIKYENNRWIVADLYSKWYDYNAKQWANAVVLNPGLTKAVGQEVTEEEVSLWYVWLPRYKYTVFNGNNGSVSEQLINVTFESGTNSTGTVKCTDNFSTNGKSEVCTDSTNGSIKNGISTYTHPAFTFGNTALKGIWIGKFELSATDSSCINDGTNIQCNKVLTIVTKPNVRSWMKAETVNFFTSIKNAATTYGISNADSHMIKNMEWGAAAYLKQSKYGLGNTIMKTNSNSSCYTGGGTGDAYKTNVMQSTTGNVYGVYDMSGGCFEYVMGFELNSNNQFNTAKSSFTTEPNFKYYDKYKYESVDYPQGALTFSRGKLGDATKETLKKYGVREGGWNGEIATFPYRSNLTFIRGGCYEDASNGVNIKAGIFYFTYTPVYAMNLHTTRAVLTAQ
jgi:competence protein ComGC